MSRITLALVVLCFAAAGSCAQSPGAEAFQPVQLQGFARDTLTIQRRSGRDTFHIWIAETPAQQEQGLMWIRQLPADHGMLFVLGTMRPMHMWMKNTYVPLDMLFVDTTGKITHITHNATPLSEEIISSGGDVAGVLEILGGEARRREIQVGDRLLYSHHDL
jgi:uncharacterized membrane protein (UPF0127 family)